MITPSQLWFDVEMRYKSIIKRVESIGAMLWFDVEMRYKSMRYGRVVEGTSCGLM